MVAIAVGSAVLSDPSGMGAMLLIMAGRFGLWRAALISNALFADTYIALFSHFIPRGVWEAIYILEGLLKNN